MQSTFSELEYSSKKRITRRDRFLAELDALTPWAKLTGQIEPFYPKGERGRPPIAGHGVRSFLLLSPADQR